MVFYESLMAPVLGTSKLEPEPFKTERPDNDVNMDVNENVNYTFNSLLERYNFDQQPRDEQELRSLFVGAYQRLKDAGCQFQEHQQQQQQLETTAATSTDVVLMQIMHQVFNLHPDWLDKRNNNQPPGVNVTGEQARAAVPDDETSSVASSGSSSNPSSSNPPSLAVTLSRQQRQTRPFKCTVCDKEFGYKHVLQNHERTHTGEKPFVCSVCKKCFTRDHHLKTHVRLHTGEKPFWCPHCNRFFVQVANLRRHLKTHTGESSYPCEYCVAFFESAAELKDHKRQHKENSKPRGGSAAANKSDGATTQKRRRGANKEAALSATTVDAETQQFSLWSPVAHGSPPPSPLPCAASSYWSSPPPQPQTSYAQQYHRQPPAVSPTANVQQQPPPPPPPPIEPYHYLQFIARFQSPERANDSFGNSGRMFQSPEQTEPEDLSIKTSKAVNVANKMIVDVSRVEQTVDLAMDLTCK